MSISNKNKEAFQNFSELPIIRKVECTLPRCGMQVIVKKLNEYGYPFNWAGECRLCGQIIVIGSTVPQGIIERIYWKVRYGQIYIYWGKI